VKALLVRVLCLLALPLTQVTLPALAAPRDSKTEIIVRFAGDLFRLPEDGTDISASVLSQGPSDLRKLLNSYPGSTIRRGFPRTLQVRRNMRSTERDQAISVKLYSTYVIHLRSHTEVASLLATLRTRPDVVLAEENGSLVALGTPNDAEFRRQWNMQNIGQTQLGSVGSDIHAASVWDRHTGDPGETISIVGEPSGDVFPHSEFGGHFYGNPGNNPHATQVAGILGATGNNGVGIAGVDWGAYIRSDNGLGNSNQDVADEIYSSVQFGSRVINNSWTQDESEGWADAIATAIVYAHNHETVMIFGMPEDDKSNALPSSYFDGVYSINVGACGDDDRAAPYTHAGTQADIGAPGGRFDSPAQGLYTTDLNNSYSYVVGTSYAVPHVAGAASLMRSYASLNIGIDLSPEDIEAILKRTADAIDNVSSNPKVGRGRINLDRAIEALSLPYQFAHGSATGGIVVDSWPDHQTMYFRGVPGLDGYSSVLARQYTVQKVVQLPSWTNAVWARGSGSVGFTGSSPENYGADDCDVVGWNGATTATLRTFVYHCIAPNGTDLGWFPTTPSSAVLAWSASSYPDHSSLAHTLVSATQSYYVPEAGDTSAPVVGSNAIKLFRTCPNNDALLNNARIKVVVRNSSGAPIAGVSPADIYILFNGGTAAQGFSGLGADSIVSNSLVNSVNHCPDVRQIMADGPTDAYGVTYITFTGSNPAARGVGVRNPNRKWGHYDSRLPVYAFGRAINGRLTEGDSNGSYELRIKNIDYTGGLLATTLGESVASDDYNGVANQLGLDTAVSYWKDFDSSGQVNSTDLNILSAHLNHDCDSPVEH